MRPARSRAQVFQQTGFEDKVDEKEVGIFEFQEVRVVLLSQTSAAIASSFQKFQVNQPGVPRLVPDALIQNTHISLV